MATEEGNFFADINKAANQASKNLKELQKMQQETNKNLQQFAGALSPEDAKEVIDIMKQSQKQAESASKSMEEVKTSAEETGKAIDKLNGKKAKVTIEQQFKTTSTYDGAGDRKQLKATNEQTKANNEQTKSQTSKNSKLLEQNNFLREQGRLLAITEPKKRKQTPIESMKKGKIDFSEGLQSYSNNQKALQEEYDRWFSKESKNQKKLNFTDTVNSMAYETLYNSNQDEKKMQLQKISSKDAEKVGTIIERAKDKSIDVEQISKDLPTYFRIISTFKNVQSSIGNLKEIHIDQTSIKSIIKSFVNMYKLSEQMSALLKESDISSVLVGNSIKSIQKIGIGENNSFATLQQNIQKLANQLSENIYMKMEDVTIQWNNAIESAKKDIEAGKTPDNIPEYKSSNIKKQAMPNKRTYDPNAIINNIENTQKRVQNKISGNDSPWEIDDNGQPMSQRVPKMMKEFVTMASYFQNMGKWNAKDLGYSDDEFKVADTYLKNALEENGAFYGKGEDYVKLFNSIPGIIDALNNNTQAQNEETSALITDNGNVGNDVPNTTTPNTDTNNTNSSVQEEIQEVIVEAKTRIKDLTDAQIDFITSSDEKLMQAFQKYTENGIAMERRINLLDKYNEGEAMVTYRQDYMKNNPNASALEATNASFKFLRDLETGIIGKDSPLFNSAKSIESKVLAMLSGGKVNNKAARDAAYDQMAKNFQMTMQDTQKVIENANNNNNNNNNNNSGQNNSNEQNGQNSSSSNEQPDLSQINEDTQETALNLKEINDELSKASVTLGDLQNKAKALNNEVKDADGLYLEDTYTRKAEQLIDYSKELDELQSKVNEHDLSSLSDDNAVKKLQDTFNARAEIIKQEFNTQRDSLNDFIRAIPNKNQEILTNREQASFVQNKDILGLSKEFEGNETFGKKYTELLTSIQNGGLSADEAVQQLIDHVETLKKEVEQTPAIPENPVPNNSSSNVNNTNNNSNNGEAIFEAPSDSGDDYLLSDGFTNSVNNNAEEVQENMYKVALSEDEIAEKANSMTKEILKMFNVTKQSAAKSTKVYQGIYAEIENLIKAGKELSHDSIFKALFENDHSRKAMTDMLGMSDLNDAYVGVRDMMKNTALVEDKTFKPEAADNETWKSWEQYVHFAKKGETGTDISKVIDDIKYMYGGMVDLGSLDTSDTNKFITLLDYLNKFMPELYHTLSQGMVSQGYMQQIEDIAHGKSVNTEAPKIETKKENNKPEQESKTEQKAESKQKAKKGNWELNYDYYTNNSLFDTLTQEHLTSEELLQYEDAIKERLSGINQWIKSATTQIRNKGTNADKWKQAKAPAKAIQEIYSKLAQSIDNYHQQKAEEALKAAKDALKQEGLGKNTGKLKIINDASDVEDQDPSIPMSSESHTIGTKGWKDISTYETLPGQQVKVLRGESVGKDGEPISEENITTMTNYNKLVSTTFSLWKQIKNIIAETQTMESKDNDVYTAKIKELYDLKKQYNEAYHALKQFSNQNPDVKAYTDTLSDKQNTYMLQQSTKQAEEAEKRQNKFEELSAKYNSRLAKRSGINKIFSNSQAYTDAQSAIDSLSADNIDEQASEIEARLASLDNYITQWNKNVQRGTATFDLTNNVNNRVKQYETDIQKMQKQLISLGYSEEEVANKMEKVNEAYETFKKYKDTPSSLNYAKSVGNTNEAIRDLKNVISSDDNFPDKIADKIIKNNKGIYSIRSKQAKGTTTNQDEQDLNSLLENKQVLISQLDQSIALLDSDEEKASKRAQLNTIIENDELAKKNDLIQVYIDNLNKAQDQLSKDTKASLSSKTDGAYDNRIADDTAAIEKAKQEALAAIEQQFQGDINASIRDFLISQVDNAKGTARTNATLDDAQAVQQSKHAEDVAKAYSDAVETLQQYESEIQKMQNMDVGTTTTKDIDQQIAKVDELEQKTEEARKVVRDLMQASEISIDGYNSFNSDFTADKTQANNTKEQIKLEDDLKKSYDAVLKSMREVLKVSNGKNQDGWTDKMQSAVKSFQDYQRKLDSFKDKYSVSDDYINLLNGDTKDNNYGLMSQAVDKIKGNYSNQIDKIVEKFKKLNEYTPEVDKKIQQLKADLNSLNLNNFAPAELAQGLQNFGSSLSEKLSAISDDGSRAAKNEGLQNTISKMLEYEQIAQRLPTYKNKLLDMQRTLQELLDTRTNQNGFLSEEQLEEERKKLDEVSESLKELKKNKDKYLTSNAQGDVDMATAGSIHSFSDMQGNINAKDEREKYGRLLDTRSDENTGKLVARYKEASGAINKVTYSLDGNNAAMRVNVQRTDSMMNVWRTLGKQVGNYFKYYFTGYMVVNKLTEAFRTGIETLKDYDTALTTISYTMDLTKGQLSSIGESAIQTAEDLSTSIENAMSVYQIYANMQTSAEEIAKTATPTLVLSNLAGLDASTAADEIQAVIQQFDMTAAESEHIVDVYDKISSNIAVDYTKGIEGMAAAVENSGQAAKVAGLSFEQLSAIVAKTQESTRQEGGQIGNSLKTIFTRISKANNLSDEVDNETLSNASKALHDIGVEVYNTDGSFREFDTIMTELAGKWDALSDAEQSNISYQVAATRQTSIFKAILANWTSSMDLATEATEANGNALANQEKYEESYSGKLEDIQTKWDSFWLSILNSDGFDTVLDIGKGLLDLLNDLADATSPLMALSTVLGGIFGVFSTIKGGGRVKLQ